MWLSVVSVFILRSLSICDRSLCHYLLLARTKRHMTLTSRGFHEKTGRFECSWSLFAALDYAVGSRGRVVMRMPVCVSNTKNRFCSLIGSSLRVFVCAFLCVCVIVDTRSVHESARASTRCTPLASFYRRVTWLSANVDSRACTAIYNAMACPFLCRRKSVDKSSFCI